MDLKEPEKDIVARLQEALGVDVKVEAYPNDVETYDFTAPKGAVLVRYQASNYTKPDPNWQSKIVQDRSGRWVCMVLHRNLREHGGVYTLLEAIRAALTGWTFPSNPESTVLYPLLDGFVKREPQKWIYQIVFEQVAQEVQS